MKVLKFLLFAALTFIIIILLFGGYLYLKKPYTAPVVDEQGNSMPGSIASLEKIKLGGVEQWICIRGKDIRNPVLLFLSSGPGLSEMAWLNYYNQALESSFVVVNWDQRGAGKSYSALNPLAPPTLEKYLLDTNELAEMLRSRFKQEKIYLVGHSWGSLLGVLEAQRHPDLYYGFVSIGQMVAPAENDKTSYQYALVLAETFKDEKTRQMLKANGPPPYSGQGMFIKYVDYITLVEKAAKINGAKGSMIDGELALVAMTAPEYSLTDKINWFRGVIKGLELVYPHLQKVDLLSGAPGMELPVYFMTGRYDYNTNSALGEKYFNFIEPPQKELIRFEKSGRNLCFSEADKFNSVMINKVLPETYNR